MRDTMSPLETACPVPSAATVARVSIITAAKPRVLSKRAFLGPAGKLLTQGGGVLHHGNTEVRELSSLKEFSDILVGLTPANALCYGLPCDPAATRIVTRERLANMSKRDGITTRTNDAFRWPDGAGIMMVDYDPQNGVEPLSRSELIEEILKAVPALHGHTMLWWPSASSCIFNDAQQLRGVSGQRLWLMVKDASDIPRAGRVLAERLWLDDSGYIRLAKSGNMLERTLVDTTVWQASRLDFAGGAVCEPPLEQRRGKPVLVEGIQEIVDTREVFADLSTDESAAVFTGPVAQIG